MIDGKTIQERIRDLRPPLRLVSPLSFWLTLGFGLFNLSVGAFLYHTQIMSALSIAGILSLRIWGIIFGIHGALTLFYLWRNNWNSMKHLMIAGAAIKTVWLLELVVEAVKGASPILVFIWALLLYVQVSTYIYFTPVSPHVNK